MTNSFDFSNIRLRVLSERLYTEYDHILFQHKVKLKKPIIRISDSKSKLGEWNSTTRTISLSYDLIERYSWDIVVEVLKHEMAHQLVSETLSLNSSEKLSKTPHGLLFKNACASLGASSWVASRSCDLPAQIIHWKDEKPNENEARLLRKVEKLLSLATSQNEHEALIAMKKVQEIYTKYNLAAFNSGQEGNFVYLIINLKKKRVSQDESMIFSILAEHFFVRVIYSELFDSNDLTTYKAMELLGTKENVLMAEYVYHFLRNKTKLLWRQHLKINSGSHLSKRSYILGALAGFKESIGTAHAFSDTKTDGVFKGRNGALISLANQISSEKVQSFVQERHPRLRKKTWNSNFSDTASFSAGLSDGKRIILSKGISSASSTEGDRVLLLNSPA